MVLNDITVVHTATPTARASKQKQVKGKERNICIYVIRKEKDLYKTATTTVFSWASQPTVSSVLTISHELNKMPPKSFEIFGKKLQKHVQ